VGWGERGAGFAADFGARQGRPAAPLMARAIMCKLMCRYPHMATNLAIDPGLLDRALAVSGEKTKKAAVTRALEEFIARREQRRLLDLFGRLDWDPRYEYKGQRSRP